MPMRKIPPEPVIETLHGLTITDPFRWIEDRNLEATSIWIANQKLRHDAYFADIAGLDILRGQVDTYLNVEVTDQPVRVGEKLFFRKRKRNQEQACIYVRDITGQERTLVDPSPQGKFASVAIHRLSNDGSLLAYESKRGGSDATEIHFVVTSSGQVLPDHLPLGYTRGLVFSPDGCGFFYCHEDLGRPEEHTIRFHRFSSASDDVILFRIQRSPLSRLILTADNLRLGIVSRHEVGDDLRTDLYIADDYQSPKWTPVFVDRSSPYEPLLHLGRIFVFTEEGAPNGRILELSTDGTEIGLIVPESESRIDQFTLIGKTTYVRYLGGRKCLIRNWHLDGSPSQTLPLPLDGTIQLLPSLASNPSSLFLTYETFAKPPQIYEYRPRLRKSRQLSRMGSSADTCSYRIDEQWYTAHDGTMIPIFVVMAQDLDPAAPNPVVMTSYGGFGVSMTPTFSVLVTILLKLRVVFALPGIRGGSEFGKAWHEAARGRHRQVAISDFIAAAEWLSVLNASTPRRLGIFGASNSGLLVAAALTQRPDLFLAVLCIAPILDMLRYEVFDNARKWRQEYGTVDDPDDFAALYRYSPYHHVADEVNYPSTLFVAGDRDDRCNPIHVRKMAGRLQGRLAQTRPILVDYSVERGHSPVLPLSVRTEALARRLAFLCKELTVPIYDGVF